MVKAFGAILAAAALLALFGCLGPSFPAACSSFSPGNQTGCIYANAVLDQNPYYCYSLASQSDREKCLTDATDPTMQASLQRMSQDQQYSILGGTNSTSQPAPAVPSEQQAQGQVPLPSLPNTTQEQTVPGQNESAEEIAAHSVAVQTGEINLCEEFNDSAVLDSCINQIATKTKNPKICSLLTNANDTQLCNLYSQAT